MPDRVAAMLAGNGRERTALPIVLIPLCAGEAKGQDPGSVAGSDAEPTLHRPSSMSVPGRKADVVGLLTDFAF